MKCCNSCSPVKPGSNINSPYANLTGGIFNFNYCPYCGRKLKDEHGKRINIEIDIKNGVIIDENKLYRDIETGEILTELELYMYYLDTDQEYSFWGYLRNCTDKNGFLEEV